MGTDAMERGAKKGLKNGCRSGADPLGMEGGEHTGMGGRLGVRPRDPEPTAQSRPMACRLPVHLARALPRRARGRDSSERDR